MIATPTVGRAELGGATVLAGADHQHVVEQTALVEVGDQAVPTLVETGAELLPHPGVMVPVRVPGAACETILVPENGDDTAAGLDQSPGGKTSLAKERIAVDFPCRVGLKPHIEGGAQLVGFKQAVGHL